MRFVKKSANGTTLRVLAVAYALAALVLLFVVAMSFVFNRPIKYFTVEPVNTLREPIYIGFLSNLGGMLWAAVFAVCVLTWFVHGRGVRSPWFWASTITLALLADDVYMLHENVYPRLFLPEELVDIGYAVAILVFAFVYRDFVIRHGVVFLPLVLVLLGTSQVFDIVSTELDHIEDSFKWFGQVTYAAFFVRAAARELERSRSAAARPDFLPQRRAARATATTTTASEGGDPSAATAGR